ncbi:hypothetical protein FXN61_07515 [Lentzea sp. PSKA42]|uniref:Uncharacterized protein n=1 Tax=Lentzea indica TaxID=2604800 RepID=A0ABX1FCV5_9PSEU|nr:hypothetical protein [Lentzea indica]NKE56687.1 hypothetical protein [Lentzea indica]
MRVDLPWPGPPVITRWSSLSSTERIGFEGGRTATLTTAGAVGASTSCPCSSSFGVGGWSGGASSRPLPTSWRT